MAKLTAYHVWMEESGMSIGAACKFLGISRDTHEKISDGYEVSRQIAVRVQLKTKGAVPAEELAPQLDWEL